MLSKCAESAPGARTYMATRTTKRARGVAAASTASDSSDSRSGGGGGGGGGSSDAEERLPEHVPPGHYVVDRVLAYDPKTKEYLIHWRGFPASDRTWQREQDLRHGTAVDRFRRRGFANVGWVFPSEDAKRTFHEKHDLIDLGELPVLVDDHTRNTGLHAVTREQRKAYVHWLKRRIGQCEWVSGCAHRVAAGPGAATPAAASSAAGWPVECFDFHHVRADLKIRNVSEMPVSIFPAESIWAEAAKCVLLCKMHHAIVEHVTHGSELGYNPECSARGTGGDACAFRGHSLYDYVHPEAGRHSASPQAERGWTSDDLLAQRGRPWAPRDEPGVAKQPKKKSK
jgi:hypothetical protein